MVVSHAATTNWQCVASAERSLVNADTIYFLAEIADFGFRLCILIRLVFCCCEQSDREFMGSRQVEFSGQHALANFQR